MKRTRPELGPDTPVAGFTLTCALLPSMRVAVRLEARTYDLARIDPLSVGPIVVQIDDSPLAQHNMVSAVMKALRMCSDKRPELG